ncbi:2849_t:CDS:2, partial [Cetraspora pellucida]
KDLSAKKSDLFLLTRDDDKELRSLNREIADLKEKLAVAEQKKREVNQQLVKANIILFSQQIKNLNLGFKISQKEVCGGKLSEEISVAENNNLKGKDEKVESQTNALIEEVRR